MFQDPSSVQAEDNKDCNAASENNLYLIPESNLHTDVVLIGEEGNVGKSGEEIWKSGEDEKQTSRLHILANSCLHPLS